MELKHIVHAIREAVDPERIMLFGSHARGDQNDDSDFDICIITKDEKTRSLDVAFKARMAVAHVTMKPMDIVAIFPSTYASRVPRNGTLEHEIEKEGVVLYG